MATCLYLRVTFIPSSTIEPKSRTAISKPEIDSVYFGLFFVISNDFTSKFYSYIHTMGSRSSVTPILAIPKPSPDASKNDIYAGSP